MGIKQTKKCMIVVATNTTQLQEMINLSDNFRKIIFLILTKMTKYEDLGRIDKAMEIVEYLNKIVMILRYWYYSGKSYKELPECIEKTLECSLNDLKNKLKILPREIYIEISDLLVDLYKQEEGLGNLEIIGENKTDTSIDYQSN